MKKELNDLLDYIRLDYAKAIKCSSPLSVRDEMVDIFCNNLHYVWSGEFIEIIKWDKKIWGYVVMTDNDKKFKKGDILETLNSNQKVAQGNIFDNDYITRWTGPVNQSTDEVSFSSEVWDDHGT